MAELLNEGVLLGMGNPLLGTWIILTGNVKDPVA